MSYPITFHEFQSVAKGRTKTLAIFSYRYDLHLVEGLLANLAPIVHGALAWDDRGDHGYHSNEVLRRNALNAAAVAAGADWILGIDPDERLEIASAAKFAVLTKDPAWKILWNFNVREMFTETAWRTDGVWANKVNVRLYPAHAVQREMTQTIHGPWYVADPSYVVLPADLDLYHLHHIDPVRGQGRRDAYAERDPGRHFERHGYDYLADRRGMLLHEIPSHRRFEPPYVEDFHQRVETAPARQLVPDPVRCTLVVMSSALDRFGSAQAAYLAADLSDGAPDDSDFAAMRSDLVAMAGMGGDAMADRNGTPAAFQGEDARWRRWTPGKARLHEGAANGQGDMAVVIIGYLGQKGLGDAVASIARQSDEVEILVVNTGGGAVRAQLAAHLDRIRLIEVDTPHRVGAARNIGIDATTAPIVAFLAGDCIASETWVAERLRRHRAGALSVSSPVLAANPRSVAGALSMQFLYRSRDPSVEPEPWSHFGRSYLRRAFRQAGYFATDLLAGEDDDFNQRVDRIDQPVWAAQALTLHRDVRSPWKMLADTERRAEQKATGILALGESDDRVKDHLAHLHQLAHAPLSASTRPSPIARLLLPAARRRYLAAFERGLSAGHSRVKEAKRLAADAMKLMKLPTPQALATAEAAAARALELCPEHWDFAFLLGCIRMVIDGQTEAALAALKRSQALRPASEEPPILSCEILTSQNRHKEALNWAEAVVETAPIVAAHHHLAARMAEQVGDLDRAIAHARTALARRAEEVSFHRHLATLHRAKGDLAQAERRETSANEIEDYDRMRAKEAEAMAKGAPLTPENEKDPV